MSDWKVNAEFVWFFKFRILFNPLFGLMNYSFLFIAILLGPTGTGAFVFAFDPLVLLLPPPIEPPPIAWSLSCFNPWNAPFKSKGAFKSTLSSPCGVFLMYSINPRPAVNPVVQIISIPYSSASRLGLPRTIVVSTFKGDTVNSHRTPSRTYATLSNDVF